MEKQTREPCHASTPRKPDSRQQELMELIEQETLAKSRTYHNRLLTDLGDRYTPREIEHAIRALRRKRILNEKQGPLDKAYTHNNKAKQFFAELFYV